MKKNDEPAYLRPLGEGVIIVILTRQFCQAVLDAHMQGTPMRQLAKECGMLESVLRAILSRELERMRG